MKKQVTALLLALSFVWNYIPKIEAKALEGDLLEENFVANTLLVELDNSYLTGSTFNQLFETESSLNVEKIFKSKVSQQPSRLESFYKLKFNKNVDLDTLIEKYSQKPWVKSIQKDYLLKAMALPNDPYFRSTGTWGQSYSDMWNLERLQMSKAWNISTGSPEVVVAVLDTGVDMGHEDMGDNIYNNTAEVEMNGIDDDGNGWVDDSRGYDFINNDNDPNDDFGHGTHVAGTIAAQGNNAQGMVGMMWDAQILPVKILDQEGYGPTSTIAAGVLYAADQGADVINLSLGGGGSDVLESAIQYAYEAGAVIVAAAGNAAIDATLFYPAAYPQVITVASSTTTDELSEFSNRGYKIDVTAPGGDNDISDTTQSERNILSLLARGTDMYGDGASIVDTNYYRSRGTSMAAPHVSGLVGLLLSAHPELSSEEIRQVLRQNTDDIEAPGFDSLTGYGRINAFKALQRAETTCEALITSPQNYSFLGASTLEVEGTTGGARFGSYSVVITTMNNQPIISAGIATSAVENALLATFDLGTLEAGNYKIHLIAKNALGKKCGEDYKQIIVPVDGADVSLEGYYEVRETYDEEVTYEKIDQLVGYELASGDVNADGFDDLVVGTPGTQSTRFSDSRQRRNGEIHLVYGGPSGIGALSLASLTDSTVAPVSWVDTEVTGRLGVSVELADVDSDGYSDVIMGLPGNSINGHYAGEICIFKGRNSATWTRNMAPEAADQCFYGAAAEDNLGFYITTGDFDGDATSDIVTSSCGEDTVGENFGAVYHISGAALSSFPSTEAIQNVASETIYGIQWDGIACTDNAFGRGISVGNAGDFDNDGIEDLAVGNSSYFVADSYYGQAYLFLSEEVGITEESFTQADLTWTQDYESAYYTFSYDPPRSIGDINGDGYDDLTITLQGLYVLIVYGGKAPGSYLLSEGFDTYFTLSGLIYDQLGLATLGDVDNDGKDDLALGDVSYYWGENSEGEDIYGAVEIIYGGEAFPIHQPIYGGARKILLATNPLRQHLGWTLASGDFDGNGRIDIVASSPEAEWYSIPSVEIFLRW